MAAPPKPETEELKVFISNRDSTCGECGEDLGRKAWITLVRDKGALCLSCADLDHLIFLPSGDAALTRRARKHALLSAVVLKWSRARKHYERLWSKKQPLNWRKTRIWLTPVSRRVPQTLSPNSD